MPENFEKSPPIICPMYYQSNIWWRFRKILWPSQNIWTLQSTLLNLAEYDLTNLFCFLGKPIVYYILEFKVRQLRTNDVNEKKARKKKETLSIDRSKLWNGGLGVYPVAIGVTIVPLQAALALTRRMLKFCTGTLPHKWAVIVSEGDMSFWTL